MALGVGVGQCPRRQNFALGIPTCWYLGANASPFCVLPDAFYPTRNLKFAFYPTRNPNASQWNIGCIGSLALGLCVGHVHFIFFVLISFALGKHSFQWNMGKYLQKSQLVYPIYMSKKTFLKAICRFGIQMAMRDTKQPRSPFCLPTPIYNDTVCECRSREVIRQQAVGKAVFI